MTSLLNELKHLLFNSGNQFLSGGFILMLFGGAVAYLKGFPKKIWNLFLHLFTVSLNVNSNEYTYSWILRWLSKQSYMNRTRRVSSKYLNGESVLVPALGHHLFLWKRRPVWFNWYEESGKTGSYDMGAMASRQDISIRIFGRSRKLLRELMIEAEAYINAEATGKLEVWKRAGSWEGGWTSEYREPRAASSLFLPKDAHGILDDAKAFLAKSTWYRSTGIPYRRGYLFYGPPGSGKSSLAVVMASELHIPLYVLNLSTIRDDNALEQIIYKISTEDPCILLIEDIDTAVPDRGVDKAKNFFSLGTLLNALDGVLARENIILVVTTNHKEVLDPALIRPGRIDRLIEFTNATAEQIHQAIQLFFPNGNPHAEELLYPQVGIISVAAVQETLLGLLEQS